MSTFLSLSDWKVKAATGEHPGAVVKYFVPDEIKAVDDAARTLQFTISTEAVDRDGDTIKASGWDIGNYLKNPVVLYGHDYHGLPIGKALRTWAENGALKSQAEFASRDIYPMADTVYQMLQAGYLRATSVGFRPKDGEYNFDQDRGGVNFLKQELLEYSIVPVPSNPQALIEARGVGIDIDPLKEWAEQILDTWHGGGGLWLPKSQVEKVFALLDAKMISIPEPAKEENPIDKGMTPADVSDKTAPEDQAWERPALKDFTNKGWGDLSTAEKKHIAGHFAWAAEDPPATYGDLKFPHHDPATGAAVWHGVAQGMARLNQAQIPSGDVAAIKAHFAHHYKQFGKEVPKATEPAIEKSGRTISAMHESMLKQAVDCVQKVLASCAPPDEPMQMAADDLLTKLNDLTEKVDKLSHPVVPPTEEPFSSMEDISRLIAEAATKQAQEFITSLTGRVF